MNTRLILLSETGNFIEWGAGCAIILGEATFASTPNSSVFAVASAGRFSLGEFATQEQSEAVRALWLQAILGAEDGGLLRWDNERQQVVDELGDDDDGAFAATPLMACLPDVTKPALYAVGFRNREGVWTRVHEQQGLHFKAAVLRHRATGLTGWHDDKGNHWQVDELEGEAVL